MKKNDSTTYVRQIYLKCIPQTAMHVENFDTRFVKLSNTKPLILKPHYISVDPYMRTRMQQSGYGYIDRWTSGSTLSGWTLSEVIHSDLPEWNLGDWAIGHLPIQDKINHNGVGLWRHPYSVEPPLQFMHPMGMTGFTAWIGMNHLGKVCSSDTVLVSAAAGGVGSIACQLAKLAGADVIVTAGRERKRDWLRKMGFQKVLNHQSPNFQSDLMKASKGKITLNFENIGGQIFESANEVMATGGRVILCGLVSQYQENYPRRPPKNFKNLIDRNVAVIPFTQPEYNSCLPEFHKHMKKILLNGDLDWCLDVIEGGLTKVPSGLIGLFAGDNLGKRIIKC